MSTDYQQSYDQLLVDAIRALTAAGRLTWTTQTPDGTNTGRCDWAEFITRALAGAAANLDGIEQALAGRPGSWEADGVRNLLTSTVGHDEQTLIEHRTEPVVVTIHVDDVMTDLGAWTAYDQAQTELQRRYDALGIPSLTTTGMPTAAELDALPPASAEQEQQADAIGDLENQLEQQRQQDWTDYGAALKTHIETHGPATPGLDVPVIVIVDADLPATATPAGTWGSSLGETLPEQLLHAAVDATPLPGAGRTPLERLETAGPAQP